MEKYEHIMIDLETMGTFPGSAIISIGAVAFDLNTGEAGKEFYCSIDLESNLQIGLIVDPKTAKWWTLQSEEARYVLIDPNRINIIKALKQLSKFLNINDLATLQVWGNSARFDLGILEAAYKAFELETPWQFYNERDVRTLVSFAPNFKYKTRFEGTAHNPIDDCKHQIKYCSAIWNKLNLQAQTHELRKINRRT